MPHHLLLSAERHTLLFHDHVEARALWVRLRERLPDARAVCLMPDHVHVVHPGDPRRAMGDASSAFAQWRNAWRGERGRVFSPLPPSEEVASGLKLRRHVRYVHLNPCRAGLVACPLAWPWSTHRDRVGLALDPWGRAARDPTELHRYVSGDPSAAVQGTSLPWSDGELVGGAAGLQAGAAAVSELLRLPLGELTQRGPGRTLLLESLRGLGPGSTREIAGLVGVSPRTVRAVSARSSPRLRRVGQVLGDPRFPGLLAGDLRREPEWRAYCRRRGVRAW